MKKHFEPKNSAQRNLYSFVLKKHGQETAQNSIEEIQKFSSYTQVRAFKAGATFKEALSFTSSLKIRALEAGVSAKKALKVKNLEQVMYYENRAKTEIKKESNENSINSIENKFHLVLDIDDVFCREVGNSNSDYIIDHQWIKSSFPSSHITNWKDHGIERTYICFPNYDKLVLTVSSWSNWSVSFFSAEESSRNIRVVTDYMSHKLGYEKFTLLIDSGKLSIFSKDSLSFEETSIPNNNKLAKDLKVIDNDIDNVILADDNPQNASINQEQVIGLSIESSKKLINMVKTKSNYVDSLSFNPLNNAAYILGIISSAKNLIDNGEAYCLREAVDITLRYEGDPSKCNTQWYTDPDCALLHDLSFSGKQSDWINKGLAIFDQN